MGHFNDVTQKSSPYLSYRQEKKHLHRSIHHAEFSTYAKFHKNPLRTGENMGPQTFLFRHTKKCTQGAPLVRWYTFFIKIGKLGLLYLVHDFAAESRETSHDTKDVYQVVK